MSIMGQRLVAKRRQMEGMRKQALETGRNRLLVAGMVMTMAFAGIAGRLIDLAVIEGGYEPRVAKAVGTGQSTVGRSNIIDRNGMILATSLPTVSLYADPVSVLDPAEAAVKLAEVMPELQVPELQRKLSAKGRFVWLARNLTPKQHHRINRLGLPGVGFHNGERRVYPHGNLVSHVLGLTDVDGRGVAGVENQFDSALRAGAGPLRLSIDLRVQSVLRDELMNSMREFKAIGAAGVVMDVSTGETVAMVSLPDYDPNDADRMSANAAFNRAAKGVYEMGSTFKLFTAAMALDSGVVDVTDGYDASKPIRVARFTISDYHAKNRWLSVPEIVLHSSNIGAAKMAMDVGTKGQQAYLEKFGLMKPAGLELPEVGSPLLPSTWRPINTMTISYGHGISVSPVQLVSGISALVNGGLYRTPT
ncbi:MAG: penicillin-binding protein 2, partial [Rhodospirillaceae bacterium]|nr:penicillin-binding protein 2 [Rhodospirillaceae bacterium]